MTKFIFSISLTFAIAVVSGQSKYNKTLAALLDTVYNEDQTGRLKIDSLQKRYGWHSEQMESLWKKIHIKDSINLIKVKNIIDTYGWVGPDEVGKQGAQTIFLVIQHADSLTQVNYLPVMQEAVKKGKARSQDLALLEDRVLTKQGKEQIYGSQVRTNETTGKYEFYPIKDETNVDNRRASVGLEPLEEYAKYFDINYVKSRYEMLADYEGRYEYSNPEALIIAASNFDTTLYAIIDDAQYPLKYISKDTFQTPQKTPLIFLRDEKGEIIGYLTEGKNFKRIAKTIEKQEWFPRRELYNKAETYQYQIPVEKDDGLHVGDLNSTFSNPEAIINMVKETIKGAFRDVHSILIWKDGKLVLEEYFYGYDEDKPHQLRSASKSFIGTLVGIAIDQGKIKSENELLLPLFKSEYEVIENKDKRKEKITVKDFLTYRHGMDCNDENPNTAGHELKLIKSPDWVKFTLDLPMIQEPGLKSSYCTGCAQALGRLVEVVTRTPLVDYADKNLFNPMGIKNYKWRFKPDTSSISTFNQMYLRPRDILKLAIMYRDNGKWQGQQIVSGEWVRKTFEKDDVEFGYLWRHKYFDVNGKRYNSYLATGNGGQKINIWPELNMITVFTGGNYNAWLYGKTTPPNEMIPDFILKAL